MRSWAKISLEKNKPEFDHPQLTGGPDFDPSIRILPVPVYSSPFPLPPPPFPFPFIVVEPPKQDQLNNTFLKKLKLV